MRLCHKKCPLDLELKQDVVLKNTFVVHVYLNFLIQIMFCGVDVSFSVVVSECGMLKQLSEKKIMV